MISSLIVFAALRLVVGSAIPVEELRPRNIDAMTVDITCRWSNCNELCPIGFVSVPRKGGKKDEMMWDDTQCLGKGTSRLCCPSNQPQPTCQWRGFHNNGKCTPGCQGGEVEVWSIKWGCKSGHQSACCTTNTPSIEAYDKCHWEGDAPNCYGYSWHAPETLCPPEFPHVAAQTYSGFGGEQICKTGAKRYCCRDVYPTFQPPAFKQCSWSTEIGEEFSLPQSCQASCPPNYLKLAVSARECAVHGGMEAYCCQGEKPSELPGHNPDAPPEVPPEEESEKVLMFERSMNIYMDAYEAGYCVDSIKPAYLSWFPEDVEGDENDAELSSAELESLTASDPFRSRVLPCDEWDQLWPDLAWLVITIASKWKKGYVSIARIWDARVACRHPRTSVADLSHFHEIYPDTRPQAYLQSMLSDMDQYARIRDTIDRLNSTICHELEIAVDTKILAVGNSTPGNQFTRRDRRFVNSDIWGTSFGPQIWDSQNRIPSLGTIFQGILDGRLSLHYARWEYYRPEFDPELHGPMLELAYWIGPQPGVDDPDPNLDRFRDQRLLGRTNPRYHDRWVIFHLHFMDVDQIFWDLNGHTYAGFNSLTVYHGYRAIDDTEPRVDLNGWRVDWRDTGRDQSGARIVFTCPYDHSDQITSPNGRNRPVTRMLVGHDVYDPSLWPTAPSEDWRGLQGLQFFVQNLYNQGYLNTAGFIHLMHDVDNGNLNSHGEIPAEDWQIRHEYWEPLPQEHDNLEANPYGVNFRINNFALHDGVNGRPGTWTGQYKFNIPMPARVPDDPNLPPPPPPGRPSFTAPPWQSPSPPPPPPAPMFPPASAEGESGNAVKSDADQDAAEAREGVKNLTLTNGPTQA